MRFYTRGIGDLGPVSGSIQKHNNNSAKHLQLQLLLLSTIHQATQPKHVYNKDGGIINCLEVPVPDKQSDLTTTRTTIDPQYFSLRF